MPMIRSRGNCNADMLFCFPQGLVVFRVQFDADDEAPMPQASARHAAKGCALQPDSLYEGFPVRRLLRYVNVYIRFCIYVNVYISEQQGVIFHRRRRVQPPSLRDASAAASTTRRPISRTLVSDMRLVGPETEIPATTSPYPLRTGAATHRMPSVRSSSSSA